MAKKETDIQKLRSMLDFYFDTSKINHSAQGLLLLMTALWKDKSMLGIRYSDTIC